MITSVTMTRDKAPTLSVVVPIYGVEKWLPEFLDSLLWQTFEDWEAILVIDGSPDGCLQIAEDYASRDGRLQVHSFINGGLGRARNRGFAFATGRYVTFPDSDDIIAPHAFETLVGSLVETGSDIVTAIAEDFYPDGKREVYWAQRSDLFAIRHRAVSLREEPRLVTDHVAWNKVFRSAMLRDNSIDYPTDTLCEDVVHSLKAYSVARAVDVIPEIVYSHRRRDDAITANIMGVQIVSDWLAQTTQACDLVVEFGDPDVLQVFVRRLLGDEIWTRLSRFNQIEDPDGLRGLVRLIARCLELATPATLDSLSPMKSLALKHAERNGLTRAWQSKGFWLSPYSDQIESLAYTAGAVVQAIGLLDPDDPLESLLAIAIVRERVLHPLSQSTIPVSPPLFPSVIRELRSLWPDDASAEQVSLRDGFERWVRDAVAHNDSEMLERAVERERAFGPGRLVRVAPAGHRFALEGTLTSTVPLTSAISFELVMRSSSTQKVRTRRVRAWQVATDEDLRWHATIPTEPEWCDEDWALWLRIFETGFDSRTLRIKREGLELTAQDVDGVGHTLRIARDRDLALSLTSAHGPTDVMRDPDSTHHSDRINRIDRIIAFPLWADNPYLNLLYLETRAQGIDVKPITRLPALLEQLARCGKGSALHLHWTSPICELADSAEEAETQTATFMMAVTDAQARGMCLIWTVHNVLPHDARFVDSAITLHAFLALAADRIHILSPATVAQTAPYYAKPESKV
ncbi:MAG: glycosyltransferase, partial [Cryobacterium sp.]|nr:glycosyltransferase [Cryobacterium sp.]